jgi:hypothetical protein
VNIGGIEQRQQTGRAASTTLPAVVAEGFALAEVANKPPCQVSETQSYEKSKPLIEGFLGFSEFVLRQFILDLSFRSEIGAYIFLDIFYNYLWGNPTCQR